MGLLRELFTGGPTPPAPVSAAGRVALAPGHRNTVVGWGTGIERLAPFEWAPQTAVWSRDQAVSVPALLRARDLICTAVGALPLTLWLTSWDAPSGDTFQQQMPPPGWMTRPDPNRTRQHILSWTTDDLFFYGRAYWKVTTRYANTYPASFCQMAATDVSIDQAGVVKWNREAVDPADVVEFLSPCDGVLYSGFRAIDTAVNLDAAANRFSTTLIPSGWLQQRAGSEPFSAEDLTDVANQFEAARQRRATAALNAEMEYVEGSMDPARLQLVEARLHQRGDVANVASIPAYFVGAPAGTGMTYMNAAQAKQDLIDFGAMPYIGALEQTLSGPNVTPNGQAVRLALNAWLRNPYTPNDDASGNDMQIAYNNAGGAPAPAPSPGQAPGRPRDIDGRNEG